MSDAASAPVPPLSLVAELLGMRVLDANGEHVVLETAAGEEHDNRAGFVHGGAMISLADTAATVLANIPSSNVPRERPIVSGRS